MNERWRMYFEFGEERHARRVARAIVEAGRTRRIETTGRLAEIVRKGGAAQGLFADRSGDANVSGDSHLGQSRLEGLDGFLTRAAGRLAPAGAWW